MIFVFLIVLMIVCMVQPAAGRSRDEQLRDLRKLQTLVFMWGWSAEDMAPFAKKMGFKAVHAPSGNDIPSKAAEVATWSKYGFKMIARVFVTTKDVWDPADVKRGCEEMCRVIRHYDKNPDVIAFAIPWGLYGEGGFPYDYAFSEKAKDAFNRWMNTPGEPLPEPPAEGRPGSLRYVKWMEFRSKSLADFRKTYVVEAKKATHKLVGTWSEFYPTENCQLNMGDAEGADFLLYDLSFGDVAVDQTRTFAECHGDMQHYKTFEEWRNHELPLMAKAAGEGVVPIAFQFPMRRGHATDFLSPTTIFTDRVEDEYSLKSGPDIRALIDASQGRLRKPEVALAYNSFAAFSLPRGKSFWFYEHTARFIEGMLHQMGVDLKVIPYEHLATLDLSLFKLVIVPDPMYLNEKMITNLARAPKVLYAGEYMLTHRDPSTAQGDFASGWSGKTHTDSLDLTYLKAPEAPIRIAASHPLMKGVKFEERDYPADQMVKFDTLPSDARVLAWVGEYPAVISRQGGRVIHVTNRAFCRGYAEDGDWLEKGLFTFLRNVVTDSGAAVRVTDDALARVREGFPYGSYGVSAPIAWNTLPRPLTLHLSTGGSVTVPAHGWAKVP